MAVKAGTWLFSRNADLLAFGGSAFLSLTMLAIGKLMGVLDSARRLGLERAA